MEGRERRRTPPALVVRGAFGRGWAERGEGRLAACGRLAQLADVGDTAGVPFAGRGETPRGVVRTRALAGAALMDCRLGLRAELQAWSVAGPRR